MREEIEAILERFTAYLEGDPACRVGDVLDMAEATEEILSIFNTRSDIIDAEVIE